MLLYVLEVFTHFLYDISSTFLYKMDQDFLGMQY